MLRPALRQTIRQTTWVLVALLVIVVGLAPRSALTMCTGDCCSTIVCCETEVELAPAHPTSECGCCHHSAATDGTPAEPERDPAARGRCRPGCCVTLLFDTDLLLDAHAVTIDVAVQLPPMLTFALATGDEHHHLLAPHDRGPPRTDARTERRRCTVFLI